MREHGVLRHVLLVYTVLFPAFHRMVGEEAYRELGDEFEDRERRTFGKDGFESAVKDVASLESIFGIDDLAKFTPRS